MKKFTVLLETVAAVGALAVLSGAAAPRGADTHRRASANAALGARAPLDAAANGARSAAVGAARTRPRITTYPVDTALTARTPGGCSYQAVVRGEVRLVPSRADESPEAAHYAPDLQVFGVVRCAGRAAARTEERWLRDPAATTAELERTVSEASTVRVEQAGRACSYAPRVSFVGGEFVGRGLHEVCEITLR